MSRCIAVANQKGGVGKTTVTINLAAALAAAGKKVLVIDMDPQGNTTSGLGIDKQQQTHTTYELLLGGETAEACIQSVEESGLDLIPANVNLAAAEIELIDIENKEFVLKKEIDPVRDRYDFLLIDCPPSLSMLTINAMTTANTVLVPIQCEYYALEGLSQLVITIDLVRERLNPALDMEGVVFTMYDARTKLSPLVVDNVRNHIREHVFKTIIPRNVRLSEAPSFGKPINLYEPRSAGTEAFKLLAVEVIERDFSQGKESSV